jgi:HK97 family phage prohead protease
MHTLDSRLEIKSVGDDGAFLGMAAVYGNVDLQGDVIVPGAFTRWLGGASGTRPIPLLWSHNPATPVGKGEVFDVPGKGLGIKGHLVLDVQLAREARALMKAGAVTGLSIGYDVRDKEWAGSVRKLTALDLWEVSLCSLPANPEARVAVETVKRAAPRTAGILSSIRADVERETVARAIRQSAREFRERIERRR